MSIVLYIAINETQIVELINELFNLEVIPQIEQYIKADYMFKDDGTSYLEKMKLLNNLTRESKPIDEKSEEFTFIISNTKILHDFCTFLILDPDINLDNQKRQIIKTKSLFIKPKAILPENNSDEDQDEKSNNTQYASPRNNSNRYNSYNNFGLKNEKFSYQDDSKPKIGGETVSSNVDKNHMTIKNLKEILNNAYNDEKSQNSTTLDILAIYLKGQKILYTEAKTYCEQHLHSLMLPAIFISSLCTLLSVVLKDFTFGPILVSALMAINSFILALISYLKLDAKAESHKISAYKYSKLQALCELTSGRSLFVQDENINILDFINKLDEQVKEIKESNQFILPENVRYRFPLLYSTNVFADIKKLYNEELVQKNRLKNILNKINQGNESLENERDRILERIIKFRDRYLQIDEIFNDEINKQIIHAKKSRCKCCNWLKT